MWLSFLDSWHHGSCLPTSYFLLPRLGHGSQVYVGYGLRRMSKPKPVPCKNLPKQRRIWHGNEGLIRHGPPPCRSLQRASPHSDPSLPGSRSRWVPDHVPDRRRRGSKRRMVPRRPAPWPHLGQDQERLSRRGTWARRLSLSGSQQLRLSDMPPPTPSAWAVG